MFREWLSAAATSVGFFTGMTYWHEIPARQAALVRKASDDSKKAANRDFAAGLKAAAD
jgi:hypothetical protein